MIQSLLHGCLLRLITFANPRSTISLHTCTCHSDQDKRISACASAQANNRMFCS